MRELLNNKVDSVREELHREIENCTNLTDNRVVKLSQLLDNFITESQKEILKKACKVKGCRSCKASSY